jgi:hypothetical protein
LTLIAWAAGRTSCRRTRALQARAHLAAALLDGDPALIVTVKYPKGFGYAVLTFCRLVLVCDH